MAHSPTNAEEEAILDAIFDAAGDERQWTLALERLARSVDAKGAMYCLFAVADRLPAVQTVHFSGFALGSDLAYATRHNVDDPHVPLGMATPTRQWFLSHEHFDRRYIERSDFFQEVMRPVGIRWVAGARLWQSHDATGCIAFQRAIDAKPFSVKQRGSLDRLTPHLSRASRLHHRFAASHASARLGTVALEGLGFGVMLVDEGLRVAYANATASHLLSHSDAFRGGHTSQLRLRHGKSDRAFSVALRTALERGTASVAILDKIGQPVLTATLMTLPAESPWNRSWQRPLAMVVLSSLSACSSPDVALLRQIYDFTPSEAALAAFLAQGGSLDAFAHTRNVGRETVRSQLKAVLAKTGTHRQAELVAKLSAVSWKPFARG